LVLDPPKEQVNVTRMLIYSFIPILALYAAWRIQKFWILAIIGYVLGFSTGLIIPFPYYLLVSIPISVIIIRYFAKKYNEKMS